MYSIVIPVYCNSASLPELVQALSVIDQTVSQQFGIDLEAIFVVDASPDDSYQILQHLLPTCSFSSKLLLHTRNFGSFAAIRTGLKTGTGPYFGILAADLQQPPHLLVPVLSDLTIEEYDVVVGTRSLRDDPLVSRILANAYWSIYRLLVMPQVPRGGVDLFGCNENFRNQLIDLEESNTSMIGLVFWLGFRRKEVAYRRVARKYGRSAWTFGKKLNYMMDSFFSFTDLPIRFLMFLGLLGCFVSIVFGLIVFSARLLGYVPVPGYAATILTITFFGGLNTLGLGILGGYVWRAYENTKCRPLAILEKHVCFKGTRAES